LLQLGDATIPRLLAVYQVFLRHSTDQILVQQLRRPLPVLGQPPVDGLDALAEWGLGALPFIPPGVEPLHQRSRIYQE